MSEIEIIAGGGRRRRWSAAEKLRIVEETLDDRGSTSVVVRRDVVASNRVRFFGDASCSKGEVSPCPRTMTSPATGSSGSWRTGFASLNASSVARRWNAHGCATGPSSPAHEILREALDKSRSKTDPARAVAAAGRFPAKALVALATVTQTNGVPMARSGRPVSVAAPRVRSRIWRRPWARAACPRARSTASAPRLTGV